jgi:hypothetical protein
MNCGREGLVTPPATVRWSPVIQQVDAVGLAH